MRDPHLSLQPLGQQCHRLGHHVRQDPRALAAADHQQRQGIVARRNIGRPRPLAHRAPHRVAGAMPQHPARQPRGPGAAGHRVHPRREPVVDPAQHAVLLVDHRRHPQQPGRGHRRDRRIAAEPHHHLGPVAQHPPLRRRNAAADPQRHHRPPATALARRRGRGHLPPLDLGRKAPGIAQPAVVGRQHHPPAAPQQLLRQRLRRKHVPAGAARREDAERRAPLRHRPPHRPPPRRMSPISPCGRLRVKDRRHPTMIPVAISDEPP